MKTLLKRALQLVLVLLVMAVGVGDWKRDLVLRLMAVNSLFDQGRIVQNFSHMDSMFLTRALPRGAGPVSPLPVGAPVTLSPAVQAWVQDRAVIGMVIRGATGRDVADLLVDKIITPMGLEADSYYVTDGLGEPFVLGGLNMRTRDYARIGQMILQNGQWNGRQIVPADWVQQSITASAPGGGYGYQWWLPPDAAKGEVMAQGVYGQYIYVHQGLGVVIALNAADRGFEDPGVYDGTIAMLRHIAAGL